MANVHLKVKREGSLLSVLIDQDITDTQLAAIEVILANDRMAYNVVEDDRINRELKLGELYPGWERFFGHKR